MRIGDKVKIEGLGALNPFEGLEGEINWFDPSQEDLGDEQPITVKVNFPVEDGNREVLQNFDKRNVIRREELKESLNEKVETIELPHEEYTTKEDIIRINDELDKKAKAGKLIGIRQTKEYLQLAEPEINGIWTIYLDENGYITKITIW